MSEETAQTMTVPDLRGFVRGHMPVMDGWRGFAILVVVIHNAGAILYGGAPSFAVMVVATVLASGWVGVQLFFVLSGFLISGILLDSVGSSRYFKNFYIRRTLRIFPLYYGFLFLWLVVLPMTPLGIGQEVDAARSDGIWYWLYLSNWTPLLTAGGINGLQHMWSLAVEEQFYLVWPALVLLAGRRFRWAVVAVVVGAPIGRFLIYGAGFDPEHLYYFTIARVDAFAVGSLLAIVARDTALLARAWPLRWPAVGATSLGLGVVVLFSSGFNQSAPGVLLVGQSLIGLWFAAFMLGSLAPRGRAEESLASALHWEWLRGFGKYSYAIYVFHVPLVQATRVSAHALVEDAASAYGQLMITFVYVLLILSMSTVLAYASWHLYEKRFLALKERWAPRAGATAAA